LERSTRTNRLNDDGAARNPDLLIDVRYAGSCCCGLRLSSTQSEAVLLASSQAFTTTPFEVSFASLPAELTELARLEKERRRPADRPSFPTATRGSRERSPLSPSERKEPSRMSVGKRESSPRASVWPISFAIGIAVLLLGLIVNPRVLAPIGAAVTVAGGFGWIRSRRTVPPPVTPPPPAGRETSGAVRYPRSRLLERATLGVGSLVALGIVVPSAGVALLPTLTGQRQRPVDLGPIDAFPERKFVIATFLSDPQAGQVSRRAAFIRNNGLADNVPSFTILSSRCTHVGCPTQPNGPVFTQDHKLERTRGGEVGLVPTLPAGGFGCPCHGSEFDTEGNRTAGPAPRALDRYQFSIRNGHLWLGNIYSVSRVDASGAQARIHAFKRLGDGEPATGPESLLYPFDPIR
jgi:Rieske Fe-S protein